MEIELVLHEVFELRALVQAMCLRTLQRAVVVFLGI